MDWKLKYKFPKGECSPEKCKKIKNAYLKPGEKNRFKASIDYQKKSKSLTVFYYLNNEMIAKHVDVPLSKKKQTDLMDQANLTLKSVFTELEKQVQQVLLIII